jgi:hypothetical protein
VTATSRVSLSPPLSWLALLLAVGCGPIVENITVATPGAISARENAVTLVVIQPTSHLHSVSLVDGRGLLVGQLDDRSHTVIQVPEGPTLLYAVLDNTATTADRIEGTLLAGRVYYATVDARPGGVALLCLNARSPGDRWSHKRDFLAHTPRVQMDSERISRAANELGSSDAILRAGDAHVTALDAAGIAEHSIPENDGF